VREALTEARVEYQTVDVEESDGLNSDIDLEVEDDPRREEFLRNLNVVI
jgi:hypothetical protein